MEGDVKRLLIWAIQKVDELMEKCESLTDIRVHGIKPLQQEYYLLLDWLNTNKEFHEALSEVYIKLEEIPPDAIPSSFRTALHDSQVIIKKALGWDN